MTRVFISYRREDAAASAGRLRDHLCRHFGDDNAFMDLDGIDYGADFERVIEDELRKCDAVLAVIGPRWADCKADDGTPRLDAPLDWVRVELTTGLRLGKFCVPVLVDGAKVPDVKSLPSELAPLLRRNVAEVTASRFEYDVERIVDAIIRATGRRRERVKRWIRRHALRPAPLVAAASVAALAVALLGPNSADPEREAPPQPQVAEAPVPAALRDAFVAVVASQAPRAEREQALAALDRGEVRPAIAMLDDIAAIADAPNGARAAALAGDLASHRQDWAVARAHYEQAVRRDPEQADYASAAGLAALAQADADGARRRLREALRLREAEQPVDVILVARARVDLARADVAAGEREAARAGATAAWTTLQALPAAQRDGAAAARLQGELALLLQRTGEASDTANNAQVEKLLSAAVEGLAQEPGAESEHATALNNLATYLRRHDRPSEAASHLRRALDVRRTTHGANHPLVADAMVNLAAVRADERKWSEALALLDEAVLVHERTQARTLRSATAYNNRCDVLRGLERFEQAEKSCVTALAHLDLAADATNLERALGLQNLALVYTDQRRFDAAEPRLRRAVSLMEALKPTNDPRWPALLDAHAASLRALGRDDEARGLSERAAVARRQLQGQGGSSQVTSMHLSLAQERWT